MCGDEGCGGEWGRDELSDRFRRHIFYEDLAKFYGTFSSATIEFCLNPLGGDIRQIGACPNCCFGDIARRNSAYMTFWGYMERLDLPISLCRGC
jgi:hypothetical protein